MLDFEGFLLDSTLKYSVFFSTENYKNSILIKYLQKPSKSQIFKLLTFQNKC